MRPDCGISGRASGSVPVDDGEPERVTDPEWEILDARWLNDSRHVAVVADAEPDAGMRRLTERAAVWRVGTEGAEGPHLLASLPGGVAAVRPSPFDDRLAVIGKDYDRQPSWADSHLYVVTANNVRRLGADLDRPVENVTTGDLVVRGSRLSFEWLDEETIVAQVGDEGRTVPYRVRRRDWRRDAAGLRGDRLQFDRRGR